jgi:transposase
MEQLIKYSIGVDGAKDKFDVCMMSVDCKLNSKTTATRKFANTPVGFREFLYLSKKHCKQAVPL